MNNCFRKLFIVSLLTVGIGNVGGQTSIERTQKGFYYPLGTSLYRESCGKWMGRDQSNGGCYWSGLYHIGVDMLDAKGDARGLPVYAISDGEIIGVMSDSDSAKVVFIRHVLEDRSNFVAVYGHIDTQVEIDNSKKVLAGQIVGFVGRNSGGNHLHFGIHPGKNIPSKKSVGKDAIGWGRGSNHYWPDTNGFVDPIEFIRSRTPFTKITISQHPISITVPANQIWFDTGVDLTGNQISINYVTGTWSNGGKPPLFSSGEGVGTWPGLIVPNARLGSLVAKTDRGTFRVGKKFQGYAGSGRLYLSMNDTTDFADNIGSITVLITFLER